MGSEFINKINRFTKPTQGFQGNPSLHNILDTTEKSRHLKSKLFMPSRVSNFVLQSLAWVTKIFWYCGITY